MNPTTSYSPNTVLPSSPTLPPGGAAGQIVNGYSQHSPSEPSTISHVAIDINSLINQFSILSEQIKALQSNRNLEDATVINHGYPEDGNTSLYIKELEGDIKELKAQLEDNKNEPDSIKSILFKYITGKGSKDRYLAGILILLLLGGLYGQVPISEVFDVVKRFIWA